jgi:hypothetical protein
MQDGPQKLTTTGRPRSDARSNGSPSSVVPAIGGAGSSTVARDLESPELTNHQTPTVVASAMARATRIGRRGVTGTSRETAYWMVADPVMVGCTEQMNE